jgi:hypothetical protein
LLSCDDFHVRHAGHVAAGRAVIAMTETAKFSFNWFTISGAVHAAAPDLGEPELRAAYEGLIGRGNMFASDLSPPLTPLEITIRDVIVKLAQEHSVVASHN